MNPKNVSCFKVYLHQQEIAGRAKKADQRATVLLDNNGVSIPKAWDYETELGFHDALREYGKKHTYFYIEYLNGRMELR